MKPSHPPASAILCASPPVLAAFDKEFSATVPAFAAFAREHRGTAVLLQLGWECESDARADSLAEAVSRFLGEAPGSRAVVLCNARAELEALGRRNVETRLANHNAFLDERRYRPIRRPKRYDAAYIARLTPFKRHALVPPALAPRLLCLGASVRASEREWAEKAREPLREATWIPRFPGAKISLLLARARCGLALSAAEGACFASSEYLLCGLPVVDTPALGGRSELYPDGFVASVEATPDAVGAGVERWLSAPPDPWRVRAAWLAKARPHREAFRALMRELTGREQGRPPHRLGLWTPHPGAVYTLAIAAFNRFAAVIR